MNRRPIPPCGTSAAYQRHRRYGQDVDAECRAAVCAERRADRARQARRRRCEIAARNVALEAVALGHPSGYEALYAAALREEMATIGGSR